MSSWAFCSKVLFKVFIWCTYIVVFVLVRRLVSVLIWMICWSSLVEKVCCWVSPGNTGPIWSAYSARSLLVVCNLQPNPACIILDLCLVHKLTGNHTLIKLFDDYFIFSQNDVTAPPPLPPHFPIWTISLVCGRTVKWRHPLFFKTSLFVLFISCSKTICKCSQDFIWAHPRLSPPSSPELLFLY